MQRSGVSAPAREGVLRRRAQDLDLGAVPGVDGLRGPRSGGASLRHRTRRTLTSGKRRWAKQNNEKGTLHLVRVASVSGR